MTIDWRLTELERECGIFDWFHRTVPYLSADYLRKGKTIIMYFVERMGVLRKDRN